MFTTTLDASSFTFRPGAIALRKALLQSSDALRQPIEAGALHVKDMKAVFEVTT